MTDILDKIYTKRSAIAQAVVKVSAEATMQAVMNKQVPKGDVFEFARAAGLLAIKKTSDVIPDCHPLPLEFAQIKYETDTLEIRIIVEAATIYKTGVEVEAMHGAAVTALTVYDMLKPIDKGVEILSIKLIEKSGGKNDYFDQPGPGFSAAVVVCSDTIASGKKEDKAGKKVIELLHKYGVENVDYGIIPDEVEVIRQSLQSHVARNVDLLLFTGGTGLSPRDVTPEAVREMIEREVPGIMEAARQYGQQRMPYAMLSRGVAGFVGKTLVITLPGSTNGAVETMQALFPSLLHIFKMLHGGRHDDKVTEK